MKTILSIIALAVFTGCYTERRAKKQVLKVEARYPDVLADICGNHYPPVDSTSSNKEYKPGPVIPKIETKYVQVNCDSLKDAQKKAGVPSDQQGKARLPCPPCDSLRVDTMIITRYQQLVNRAKETAQTSEIKKLTADNAAMTAKRDNWRKLAWIAWGIIALFFIIKWGWKALKTWVLPV